MTGARESYDVIVAGGGSAGVAAAIGARRTGARTLLIERGPCLGGASTLRNVLTYCGIYTRQDPPRQVVFGVAEDVLAALHSAGAVSAPTRFTSVAVVFDPESVKRVLDELCRCAEVEVLLHTQVIGGVRDGRRVRAIRVVDHGGVRELSGAAFVDATGEADLAAFAGASVRYGNHGRVQNGSLGIRIGGIPSDVEVSRTAMRAAVLDGRSRGIAPLISEHGLVARLPISGDVIAYVVDEGYDARDARDVSRAEAHARLQARAYVEALRLVPGCERAYLVTTGPELGTRESRHVAGRYQMTTDQVLSGARFADAIATGAWPVEYHPGPGVAPEWRFIAGDGSFDIPLRALHSADTDNLFAAGRNVDGDRLAGSSLRVMGTAFATGHAAGIAAAFIAGAVRGAYGAVDVAVDVAAVRRELGRQNANLEPR